jgi:hypothetical protein
MFVGVGGVRRRCRMAAPVGEPAASGPGPPRRRYSALGRQAAPESARRRTACVRTGAWVRFGTGRSYGA